MRSLKTKAKSNMQRNKDRSTTNEMENEKQKTNEKNSNINNSGGGDGGNIDNYVCCVAVRWQMKGKTKEYDKRSNETNSKLVVL